LHHTTLSAQQSQQWKMTQRAKRPSTKAITKPTETLRKEQNDKRSLSSRRCSFQAFLPSSI
jgi:hypothetical protein